LCRHNQGRPSRPPHFHEGRFCHRSARVVFQRADQCRYCLDATVCTQGINYAGQRRPLSEAQQETKDPLVVQPLKPLSGGVDHGVIAESFDWIGGRVMIVQEFDQNIVSPERSQCLDRAASNLKEAARLSLE